MELLYVIQRWLEQFVNGLALLLPHVSAAAGHRQVRNEADQVEDFFFDVYREPLFEIGVDAADYILNKRLALFITYV